MTGEDEQGDGQQGEVVGTVEETGRDHRCQGDAGEEHGHHRRDGQCKSDGNSKQHLTEEGCQRQNNGHACPPPLSTWVPRFSLISRVSLMMSMAAALMGMTEYTTAMGKGRVMDQLLV